jgi:DNA-binding transcriptional LysR family regulator
MQWSLEQLRQFVAVAEQGSISAAARRLGKVQSAVSTAIALLEADLNVTLIDRSQHKAALTDAGQLLLPEAQELLRQAAELQERANALAAGEDAMLGLALDEALPYAAVRTLVREMSERYPNLELTLLNGTATEVAEYVEQRRADIAINFDRGPLLSSFDQRHIGAVPQGVFVARGHPLLAQQPARKKDLANFRQLLLHADDVQQTAYSPKVWRSDSFYSIAEMVADKLGWAVLPINIAEYEGYPESLLSVECTSLALPLLSVRMFWLQGKELSQTALWVGERFGELVKKLQ